MKIRKKDTIPQANKVFTDEAIDMLSWCLYLAGKYKEAYEVVEKVYADAVSKFGENNSTVLLQNRRNRIESKIFISELIF